MSEPVICAIQRRPVANDYCVTLNIHGRNYLFTTGNTPYEAVKSAQDRAANFVRGLADLENQLKGVKTIK